MWAFSIPYLPERFLAWRPWGRLHLSVTRCCNNYGPYQYPEKVIPLFVTNLLDGKPVRGWLHVDDHCRGIQLVLARGQAGRVYHISGDTEPANRDLTAAILGACGASWDMAVPVADRPGQPLPKCRAPGRTA